jgi:hypothetical protein
MGGLILNWNLNLKHGDSFKWYLSDECLQFNLYLPKQTVLTTAMCIQVPNGQFCPVVDIYSDIELCGTFAALHMHRNVAFAYCKFQRDVAFGPNVVRVYWNMEPPVSYSAIVNTV